ncbi:MAG: hypothetical protein ACK4P4_02830 [Allorhizobium sp.]
MKKVEDFIAAARSVHDGYAAGRMDREIVQTWVLGLGDYPAPHGPAVADAKAWFKKSSERMDTADVRGADLARLQKMFEPS